MNVTYTFSYTLGETVLIDDEIKGRVIGLLATAGGYQYHVSWWSNGECRSEWFAEWRVSGSERSQLKKVS